MIYGLLIVIVALSIYCVIEMLRVKRLNGDKEELQKKLNTANVDIRLLKKNYENFKKVYDSLLKKNNTLDKEYKHLKKTIGRR